MSRTETCDGTRVLRNLLLVMLTLASGPITLVTACVAGVRTSEPAGFLTGGVVAALALGALFAVVRRIGATPSPRTLSRQSPTYPADARDAGLADRATQVAKGAATVVSAAVIALAVAAMCGIALLFLALAFAPDPL